MPIPPTPTARPRHRRWAAHVAVAMLVLLVALLLTTYTAVVVARLAGYGVVVTRATVDDSIPAGSVVVGRWVAPAEMERGTRVIFQERDGARAGGPRVHRVLELTHRDGRVLARTDAGDRGDRRYVLSESVIAPAFSLRFVGYLLSLLLTPAGWLLGFALPTGALCFLGLRRIWIPTAEPVATPLAAPRASAPNG